MIVKGVFNSCDALVMNAFCFLYDSSLVLKTNLLDKMIKRAKTVYEIAAITILLTKKLLKL